jgi:putative ABC transport system permease protein
VSPGAKHVPPPDRIRRWLLGALTGPAGQEAVRDLDREYELRTAARGGRPSRTWYLLEAVRLRWHFTLYGLRRGARGPENTRDVGAGMADTMTQTAQHVMRMFRRSPGFAGAAILTVALGIAATVSVFSVVNSVLLKPLPYDEPDRLAALFEWSVPRDQKGNVANPGNVRAWEARSSEFQEIAQVSLMFPMTVTGTDEAMEIRGHLAEVEFFDVLGVEAQLGRTFSPEADLEVRELVLSHGMWTRVFGGDPSVLGRSLVINGVSSVVVGVLPPGLIPFGEHSDAWVSHSFDAADQRNSGRWTWVVGRLAPDATLDRARQEMAVVGEGLEEEFPDFNAGWRIQVESLTGTIVGDVQRLLWVLLGAVGLLLLIAAANVASLHLVRATERRHEMAIRTSLGATGGRLGSQLLAESLTLAGLGALLGVALARVAMELASGALAGAFAIPRINEVAMDSTVALFAVGVTVLTGLLFGMAPAIHALRTSPASVLQAEGRGPGRGTGRARNAMVVLEVALSLVLLVGAGLVGRSFATLSSVDSGFRSDGVVTGRINLTGGRYDGQERQRFHRAFLERAEALPGVTAVGSINFLPLDGMGAATSFWAGDQPVPPEGERPTADVRAVSGEYFRAMGIDLIAGSTFDGSEGPETPRTVVINRTTAEMFWPGESPIGRTVVYSWDQDYELEVVGVVADVRLAGLDSDPRGIIYMPFSQFPDFAQMNAVLRTPGDPLSLAGPLRSIVRELDPEVPLANLRVMDDVVAVSVARPRMASLLMGAFAALALVLSSVGLYGVVAYSVSRRTREIGIRMAMGADRGDVVGMVTSQGMKLAGTGFLLGTVGALILGRVLEGLLFGVSPRDPLVLAGAVVFLGAVALLASLIPASRATRVQPRQALAER